MDMQKEAAIRLLKKCERSELRDHCFGDREIYFDIPAAGLMDDPDFKTVFDGYQDCDGSPWDIECFPKCHDEDGNDTGRIMLTEGYGGREGISLGVGNVSFTDTEARELLKQIPIKHVERNDVCGDDRYRGG
jgi:hypothetical protein